MKKLIYTCALLLLSQSILFAASINLDQPVKNTITSKEIALFKGDTSDIKTLSINGVRIPLKNGAFYAKIKLARPKSYNYFNK